MNNNINELIGSCRHQIIYAWSPLHCKTLKKTVDKLNLSKKKHRIKLK